MPHVWVTIKDLRTGKMFLVLAVAVLLYWLSGKVFNIYRFAAVGAIYELLWLCMIVILFLLPVVSLIFWIKQKFSIRSFHLYSLLISVGTILLLLFA